MFKKAENASDTVCMTNCLPEYDANYQKDMFFKPFGYIMANYEMSPVIRFMIKNSFYLFLACVFAGAMIYPSELAIKSAEGLHDPERYLIVFLACCSSLFNLWAIFIPFVHKISVDKMCDKVIRIDPWYFGITLFGLCVVATEIRQLFKLIVLIVLCFFGFKLVGKLVGFEKYIFPHMRRIHLLFLVPICFACLSALLGHNYYFIQLVLALVAPFTVVGGLVGMPVI